MRSRLKRIFLAVVLLLVFTTGALTIYIRYKMSNTYLPRYGIGDVGIVASDIFVLTKTRDNETIYDNVVNGTLTRFEWKGASGSVSQTVLVTTAEGVRQHWFILSVFSKPVLIHFSPDKISSFDFGAFYGGNYLRDINQGG